MNTKYFVNGREYYLTPEQIKQIESICTASEGSQLVAKKISELSNNEFYVKDYQRGYRWDETEIEALLEDIDNIDATEDGYCMQPLVVKKITEKQKHKPSQKLGESNKVEYTMPNGSYELLDGQQRLTTLWLIQAFLESKSNYSIYYELTRKTDEYYIENAKSTIEKWFKLQQKFNSCRTNTRWAKGKEEQFVWNEANKKQYCEKMRKLFFIWYEVSNENVSAEKVFQSINEGKIELTNAELFKALLLNPDNVSNEMLAQGLSRQVNSTDQTFYFIVNAGTVSLSDVDLTIAYASATKKYKAKLQGLGTGTETFVRGKQYSYTLKISDGVLTMTGNEIKEWETGNNVGEIVINGEEQQDE